MLRLVRAAVTMFANGALVYWSADVLGFPLGYWQAFLLAFTVWAVFSDAVESGFEQFDREQKLSVLRAIRKNVPRK